MNIWVISGCKSGVVWIFCVFMVIMNVVFNVILQIGGYFVMLVIKLMKYFEKDEMLLQKILEVDVSMGVIVFGMQVSCDCFFILLFFCG